MTVTCKMEDQRCLWYSITTLYSKIWKDFVKLTDFVDSDELCSGVTNENTSIIGG